MRSLIEYSGNYLKAFGILWQFYRDLPALNNHSNGNQTHDHFVC